MSKIVTVMEVKDGQETESVPCKREFFFHRGRSVAKVVLSEERKIVMVSLNGICQGENFDVWRYMDFLKFLDLLRNQSLYFTNVDVLRKSDPYECRNTLSENMELAVPVRSVMYYLKEVLNYRGDFVNAIPGSITGYVELMEVWNQFLNCWHINASESIAMWKLYSNEKTGIAVQSSIDRLKECFSNEENIEIGKVTYIDYNLCTTKQLKGGDKAFRKHKPYEYENELRVLYKKKRELIDSDPNKNGVMCKKVAEFELGISMKVNINILIEKIYIAPACEEWIEQLFRAEINEHYAKLGCEAPPILKSSMFEYKNVEGIEISDEIVKSSDDWIENSSLNPNITYKVAYDENSGEIKGFYPDGIVYDEIPEPYINIDSSVWKILINNQGEYKIDVVEKKIVKIDN